MARTLITGNTVPKNNALNPVVWTNADAGNNHYYTDDGDTVLLIRNTDTSAKTVTIASVADPDYGRTGDNAIVVAAASGGNAGFAVSGQLTPQAWRQPGTNQINVNVSAATGLQLAAITVTRR